MREQLDKHFRSGVLFVVGSSVVAIFGISVALGRAERVPECALLARLVAERECSMPHSRRFLDTERHAYGVCARDPAAFRKLIRNG